jgi:NAD+ synthetase
VGGNDELLFDGRSAVWTASGEIVARARAFDEDLLVTDLSGPGRIEPEPMDRADALYRALVLGVRDYAKKCGFQRAVIGLSGGIDSAVTAAIAADALGPANVLGVAMPTRYSSEGSLVDAQALARNLGVDYRTIDIDPIFASYEAALGTHLSELGDASPGDVTLENIQARARGATLMAISNRTGALVLTTETRARLP